MQQHDQTGNDEMVEMETACLQDAGPQALLRGLEADLGFVPKVFDCLSEAPSALGAFMAMNQALAQSSLSPLERDLVLLTVSRVNDCGYCVAGHSTLATESGMARALLTALREGRPLTDEPLEALRCFAQALTERRGQRCQAEYKRFLAAGFTSRKAKEVILVVATKSLSNSLATLFALPLDEAFIPHRWSQRTGTSLCA